MPIPRETRSREALARRRLASRGYTLSKSRVRIQSAHDGGGYSIVGVAGPNHDLSLEDVEKFIATCSAAVPVCLTADLDRRLDAWREGIPKAEALIRLLELALDSEEA